ncbi:MAG: magnesium/cobalt transporter CorA [Bacteroidota bacterium]|nr:magnesium/cobalt transporter CorA [Candidatus Kapabacteria bacterium]MDW8219635.1 magnesium/cobalt transporter CorA [Bacteroidota bacterium]
MVTILGHNNGKLKQLTMRELCILLSEPDFRDWTIWVDMTNPTEQEEETVLIQMFLFHHLAVEDCQRERIQPEEGDHFPKVEDYGEYLYVIFNPIDIPLGARIHAMDESEEEPPLSINFRTRQLNTFLGENYIVTHHYEPSIPVEYTMQLCWKNNNILGRGPDYLFHIIIDQIVDQYAPVMEYFDDVLEEAETRVINSQSSDLLVQILRLKKSMQRFKRITTYQREILSRLARGEFGLISMEEMAYYRNVYDHLVRIVDVAESYRDIINGLVDAYLSVTSNRTNSIMKVLTMMSTIFLPLTLITGIYGMNFEYLPELKWQYGYFMVLGLLALVAGGMLLFFRKKGWLDS